MPWYKELIPGFTASREKMAGVTLDLYERFQVTKHTDTAAAKLEQ